MAEDDKAWLLDLKVGDEIAIAHSGGWYHEESYTIHKVTKISPKRRLTLSNGSQYHPNGKKMGETYCYPLRKVTQEVIDSMEKRDLKYKLKFDLILPKLSLEQLRLLLTWQEELLPKKEDTKE